MCCEEWPDRIAIYRFLCRCGRTGLVGRCVVVCLASLSTVVVLCMNGGDSPMIGFLGGCNVREEYQIGTPCKEYQIGTPCKEYH